MDQGLTSHLLFRTPVPETVIKKRRTAEQIRKHDANKAVALKKVLSNIISFFDSLLEEKSYQKKHLQES